MLCTKNSHISQGGDDWYNGRLVSLRRRLLPLFVIQFVNTLGYSVIIPILPFIVRKYEGGDIAYGLLISSFAFCQFFGAPILGALSDQMGRKKILVVSQIGTVIGWIIFALAWFAPTISVFGLTTLPILLILISRMVDGLTGGNLSVANAYLSDVTPPAKKAQYFGIMGAIMGVAFVIGPAIGGLLATTSLGYLATVLGTMSIAIFSVLLTAFALPESLELAKRSKASFTQVISRLHILGHIKSFAHVPEISKLLQVRFFVNFVFSAYIAVISLYLIDAFSMSEKQLGFFFLAVGVFSIINQAFLVKQFVSRLGERKTLTIGLTLTIFGLVAITMTHSLLIYTFLYYVLNLGLSLINPAIKSLLSGAVTDSQQGEIMGLDESLSALAAAISPLFAGFAYEYFSSGVFYLIAGCSTIALVVWVSYMRSRRKIMTM